MVERLRNALTGWEQAVKIDSLEAIQLDDTVEWIRVRASDPANPVLLMIQQGPGLPMLNEVRRF